MEPAKNNSVNSDERKALLEQSAAVFAMHGLPDSEQVRALMAPLENGLLNFDEHMKMLEGMMQRLLHVE